MPEQLPQNPPRALSGDSSPKEMTFLDHLEELRWHIIRSVASILIFTIAAFVSKEFVFGTVILGPSRIDFWTFKKLCDLSHLIGSEVLCITDMPFTIQSRQMTGQFTMHITSSIVIGLIVAFPYVFWEIWRFIKPALYSNERNVARGTVFFVSILFFSGILFGYYIIVPLSVNFLANYTVDPSIINEFDITSYVSTVAMLVLACGLMFQLPIITYFFSKVGIVTPELMIRFRKHSIIVIMVISAILTPPDVMSQILISIPLILLYELSIIISRIVNRAYRKSLA